MNWGIFGSASNGGFIPLPSALQKRSNNFVHIPNRPLASPVGQQTRMSSARNLSVSRESFEVTVSGGSTFARMKLKEIDGMAPQGVERAV